MTKLNERQMNLLKLIKRSKPEADGWYRASKIVWPLIADAFPADLAETRGADEGGYIRLTDRGQAVSDYL
jgi:hypothetical protein